jgi:uncharacterized membrane protein
MYVSKKMEEKKMNVNFEYAKTLAGEGSLLLLLSLVPYAGWILGIIGVVLLLRGMRELTNYYQDEKIYKDTLTGVKFYIVAIVAAAVAIAAMVVGVGTATNFNFTSTNFVLTVGFGIGLLAFFGGLVIAFIFYVLATTHLRKTLNALAQKSGEASFTTAANLLWWGAIFTIIVVGLLFIFIAWIFATIGFFTMKSRQYQQYNSQSNGNTQPPTQPESGKTTEVSEMNKTKYVQLKTLAGRGI